MNTTNLSGNRCWFYSSRTDSILSQESHEKLRKAQRDLEIRNENLLNLEVLKAKAESVKVFLDPSGKRMIDEIVDEAYVRVLNIRNTPQGELLLSEDWGFE